MEICFSYTGITGNVNIITCYRNLYDDVLLTVNSDRISVLKERGETV